MEANNIFNALLLSKEERDFLKSLEDQVMNELRKQREESQKLEKENE